MTRSKSENDDSKLIEHSRDGCRDSFGDLVRKYQDRLYNSLVHFMGSASEAEDVAQEAFVLAYTRLDSFRGDSAFYTWLYRIAVNTAISQKRKRRPTVSTDRQLPTDTVQDTSDGHAPEHAMLREETVTQVHQALDLLSEEHREILVLREIEGYDYDAISELCEIPVGTVRSRLHRARGQLKTELERIENQHPVENQPSIETKPK